MFQKRGCRCELCSASSVLLVKIHVHIQHARSAHTHTHRDSLGQEAQQRKRAQEVAAQVARKGATASTQAWPNRCFLVFIALADWLLRADLPVCSIFAIARLVGWFACILQVADETERAAAKFDEQARRLAAAVEAAEAEEEAKRNAAQVR